MPHRAAVIAGIVATAAMCAVGCHRLAKREITFADQLPPPPAASEIQPVAYEELVGGASLDSPFSAPPFTLSAAPPTEYWDLTLAEVVQYALSNAAVLRDLGAVVVRTPNAASTPLNPSVTALDPRTGVEAALAEFDAVFNASANFEKNNRAINNVFFSGGLNPLTAQLQQDLHDYVWSLNKTSATGGSFAFRHLVDYNASNSPGNTFPSAWDVQMEGEIRQPLLRHAGVEVNRIAGPNAVSGNVNGVVIARIRRDGNILTFEGELRDYLSNLENTYWELYFAYRQLSTRAAARNRAEHLWEAVRARYQEGGVGADEEALTREQYLRFEEQVQEAYSGRQLDTARVDNGSPGGTLRAVGGVLTIERRLRLLMGAPINDGRALRPVDDPSTAELQFDWAEISAEAATRVPELRRQRLAIRKRSLELVANRKLLRPQLDAVALYRWRGLGQDLINSGGSQPFLDNAYNELVGGKFQEWQLGVEFSTPLGRRAGWNAIRHSQLELAREQALLSQQEQYVLYWLSNAVGEKDRAFHALRLALDRQEAAQKAADTLNGKYENEQEVDVTSLLDAERRLSDASAFYYHMLAEYAVAVKNIHYVKGSLFEYNNVMFGDSTWDKANQVEVRRKPLRRMSYRLANLGSSD